MSRFLLDRNLVPLTTVGASNFLGCSVLDSEQFAMIHDGLLEVWFGSVNVYTDSLLKFAGSSSVISETAAYFPALNSGVGIGVHGLLFLTLSELQAVALALKCIPSFCSVVVHLDSQAVIDACVFELALAVPDFCNCYWVKRKHIVNLIKDKDLTVSWVKVKGYSGVSGNDRADALAGEAARSLFFLPAEICKCFLLAENTVVSDNACYFVRDIFRSVCCACWEAGPDCNMILVVLLQNFDWVVSTRVWHPDLHMFAGFTSRKSVILCTYLIKALHKRLSVAVHKRLYDKSYPGIWCLLCGEVELLDHVFIYSWDVYVWEDILSETSMYWISLAGACDLFSFSVLKTLDFCHLDVGLYLVLCKEFVFKNWCVEAVGVFDNVKSASSVIIDFVRYLVELY